PGTVGRAAVYVSEYSGPEPPSGGVKRPPLAVIAPHWTQLDGVTTSFTSSPSAPSPRSPSAPSPRSPSAPSPRSPSAPSPRSPPAPSPRSPPAPPPGSPPALSPRFPPRR